MIYFFFSAIILGIIGYLLPFSLSITFIIIFFLSLLINFDMNFKEFKKKYKIIEYFYNEIFVFKFVIGFVFAGVIFKFMV